MIRALHLDLKGLPPTAARLAALPRLIAAAGYTAILVEWEDQFPWADARYRSETAYTPAEVADFHRAASAAGLEVIPLVQCLGHLETFLRPPGNAALRELEERVDVLNPLAPGAADLITGLVDEVLAATPGCRHLHLGGDEAWSFAANPATAAYAERHGRAALYLHHARPLCTRLAERGVRPLLWHDMMADWDDAGLAAIAPLADLCAWGYHRYDRSRFPWLRATTPAEDDAGGPLLYGGPHPVGPHLLERFHRAGIRLWGAGCFRGGGSEPMHQDVVDTAERLGNARDWLELGRQVPLAGLIATGWARNTTDGPQKQPLDACLDTLVAVGLAWSGGDPGQAATVLAAAGEGERAATCRAQMARLYRHRSEAWANAIRLREMRACHASDPRRRSPLLAGQLLGYLRDHVLALLRLEPEILTGFAGLVPECWLRRYLAERLAPLREELHQLDDPGDDLVGAHLADL